MDDIFIHRSTAILELRALFLFTNVYYYFISVCLSSLLLVLHSFI
jgi:hypothetical protein